VILCVDIGNSRTKIARVANRRVHDFMTCASDASDKQIERALRRVARGGIDAAAVSSVRPRATAAIRAVIRGHLGIDPFIMSARARLPIEMATRHPGRVGVDRVCAACGALPARAQNAIVIDAGSAITVDLVLGRRFLGGVIMAGPQMSLSALHRYTAQLPELTLAAVRGDAFDDTARAMQTGAVVGAAGAVEAAVRLMRKRAGSRTVPVWLTGGHATTLESRLAFRCKLVSGLTLIGLAEIARHR